MHAVSLRVLLCLLTPAPLHSVQGGVCTSDESCSLNGHCSSGGVCDCRRGWRGAACAQLNLTSGLATPNRSAAAIYGFSPNVSSWGGNVVLDDEGRHHLFVAEMTGGCGLAAWGRHCATAHAVSTSGPAGPYRRVGLALPAEACNPQVIRFKGRWLLFHIGSGEGGEVSPCGPDTPRPPGPPPPRPSPGGGPLCSRQAPVRGYSCNNLTCGGATPSTGNNCGQYLSLPALNCSSGARGDESKDCAARVAALCDADPRCRSFSLLDPELYPGTANHIQLFAGGKSCLRPNPGWSTWVRDEVLFGGTVRTAHGAGDSAIAPASAARIGFPGAGSAGGSAIHSASSPDGPWKPLELIEYPGCNNPSPWAMENGTLVVLCTWFLLAAEEAEGPWRRVGPLPIEPSARKGVAGAWEDPFLFQDTEGNWHVLAHTYTRAGAGPQNSISGHIFSRDLRGPWTVSPVEPYTNAVRYADGTEQMFSTMERPKLLFDGSGVPTHLINGVSPVYPCSGCNHSAMGGDAPVGGGCCWCKILPGHDWTYTLMQPL